MGIFLAWKTNHSHSLAQVEFIIRGVDFLGNWIDKTHKQKSNKRLSKPVFFFLSLENQTKTKNNQTTPPWVLSHARNDFNDHQNMAISPQYTSSRASQFFSWVKKITSEPPILNVKWIICHVPHLLHVMLYCNAQTLSTGCNCNSF